MLNYDISEEESKTIYNEIVKRDITAGTILEGKDGDNYEYLIVLRFARKTVEDYRFYLECIKVITVDKIDNESLRMVLLMHINGVKRYFTVLEDFKTLKRYKKGITIDLKNDVKQRYDDIIEYVKVKAQLKIGSILTGITGNGTPFSLVLLDIDKELGVYYFLKTLVHKDDLTEDLLPSLIEVCTIATTSDTDLYFYKYVRDLDEKFIKNLRLKMKLLGVF